MTRNLIIDGNNLLHRAFHVFALNPTGFCSDSGYPTGMIYGPLSMLADWIPSMGSFDFIHFFNDGVPSRRRKLDPDYKKRDPSRPSPLSTVPKPLKLVDGFEADGEVSVLMHILKLLGVNVYFDPNEEADDMIASFVKKYESDYHVIVSSDKDFFQLLTNPRVAIYRPGNSAGPRMLDAEESEKHWSLLNKGSHPAVPSDCVRIFKSLCGDASDSIPGVPRLRKKVAVESAIKCDRSIDKMMENDWPGFSDTEKQKANSMIGRIKLNWELVGLVDDLKVEPVKDVSANPKIALDIIESLNIGLDVSFLTPSSLKIRTADAPAKILDSDWTKLV